MISSAASAAPIDDIAAAVAASDAALSDDVSQTKSGVDLASAPLWPDGFPLETEWQARRLRLVAADDDWSSVIAWYEHLLDPKGRTFSVKMLTEIALIPKATWEEGPSEVVPLIGEIWERYHRAKTGPTD